MGARTAGLLVAAWFAAFSARADPGVVVVLYGPGPAGADSEARALAAYHAHGPHPAGPASVRHAATVLQGGSDVTLVGSDEVVECVGAPVTHAAISADLDGALKQIQYLETQEATLVLAGLEAALPCLSEPLPRDTLSRIFFLEGVALAHADADEAAVEAFRQALVVDPMLAWDARFPPGHAALFQRAIEAALRTERGSLEVAPRALESARVWVDGEPLAAGGVTLNLGKGRHLLQWEVPEGTSTRVLPLEAGVEVVLYGRADLLWAVLRGEGCGPCVARGRAALARLAGELEVAEVSLAEQGAVDLLHRYDAADATWTVTSPLEARDRLQANAQRQRARRTVLAGGGVGLAGAALWAVSYAAARDQYARADEAVDWDDDSDRTKSYGVARALSYAGLGIAGIGGGVVVTGVALGPWRTAIDVRVRF